MQDGIRYIKNKLKTLPNGPGVYRMLNAKGVVLYVGKAKSLRKRVTNYTQAERLSHRIRKMVFETCELVIVETPTEAEALLLEISLIKALKPKYNVVFKDDSSYVQLLISEEDVPQVRAHRGKKTLKGHYFGPYPSADAVYKTIDLIERVFQLRSCKNSVFKHRTRPCLKYDIKRCSAPCVGKISPAAYAKCVREAKAFLNGHEDKVQKRVQQRMQAASVRLEYEEAAKERDRLKALVAVTSNRTTLTHGVKNADVFALARVGNKACVQAFYYRHGRHVGNVAHFPKCEDDVPDAALMQAFLGQYYEGKPVPPAILCNILPVDFDVLAAAFRLKEGHVVEIIYPQRGEKRKLLQQVQHNAQQALQRKVAEETSWNMQMAAFGTLLGLKKPVKRVETFDISNIFGKFPVASLVVAGEEGMLKKEYRKFKIRVKETPDDYAMMAETLTRRYTRLLKESAEEGHITVWPDVVMVDGGVGHLNVLVHVMKELAVLDQPSPPALCGIAKGEERDKGLERIFLWKSDDEIVQLPIEFNTPLIFLLQQIRDEAHRFAIGFHRQKRSKKLTQSALERIPGIGAKRKKALLLHFGALVGVKGASVEELMKVDGISKLKAEEIYYWFRGGE